MSVYLKIILFAILVTCSLNIFAQQDDNYIKVVNARAYKIVAPLGIKDSAKFYRVRDQIAREYIAIKQIDDEKEKAIATVKQKNLEKQVAEESVKSIGDSSEIKRFALNKKFIQELSRVLNADQIEKVKDGLTYNVLPNTYKAHLDMIPSLKAEEKKYIYDALFEAREHAMAAGSSDAKHAWFGKYKGRINNYLAARGYDLRKEREAWYERNKEQEKK